VSCIDCFVVVKGVVADFAKFVSLKIASEVLSCAVVPVFHVPVCGFRVDCFERNGAVNEFFPQFVFCGFLVDC